MKTEQFLLQLSEPKWRDPSSNDAAEELANQMRGYLSDVACEFDISDPDAVADLPGHVTNGEVLEVLWDFFLSVAQEDRTQRT